MSTTAKPSEHSSAADTRRAILNTLKGSSGNLVEWYDVYIYTVFVSYFETQFFAPEETNSTIYVYAIFAVTFLMRPVGSWYFGRYADRHGRRAALTFSITLMAACSFVIAIMPTRATLGALAAVVLIVCRLVQGFATGGEYGTSATYMSEAATRERRGFFSSFQYVTLIGGHVLAQLTLLIMFGFLSEDQVRDWGWRIPFAIGGLGALVVLWMRRTMDESLSAEQLAEGEEQLGRLAARAVHPVPQAAPAVLPDHAGRHGRVLHLQRQRARHHQVGVQGRRADRDVDQPDQLDLPHGAAAVRRHAQRPDRPETAARRVRRGRGRLHVLPHHLPAADEERRALLPAGRRGLRHPHRVHVDQRDREGRALPVPHPGVGRRVGYALANSISAAPRR